MNDEDQISTLASIYFCCSDLVYDRYEFESWEDIEGDDVELMSIAVVENEEEVQYQPLVTSFSTKVDHPFLEIGEPIVDILQS